MSLTIFAGSMEFVTVNLLLGSFDPFSAFLMALMINARHLFYGIAMLILRLSGSATMAVLALLLYELLNEFAMSDAFVFYKVYGSLTVEIFCVRYVPLLVIALVCILLAFTTNGHAGRAAD